MIAYKASILCSFAIEGMDEDDDEWNDKYNNLRENIKFNLSISDFIVQDLDSKNILDIKIITKHAKFSDFMEGVINAEVDLNFECPLDIDEVDQDTREDVFWDVKNGLILRFDDIVDYEFIIRGEDTEIHYEKNESKYLQCK